MDSEEGKNDDDGDQAFLFLAKMVKLMRNLTVKSSRGFFILPKMGIQGGGGLVKSLTARLNLIEELISSALRAIEPYKLTPKRICTQSFGENWSFLSSTDFTFAAECLHLNENIKLLH